MNASKSSKFVTFLSLFTSTGTLVCCALPALFVALGAGATFAGLLGNFPQLIWVSENKTAVFVVGAVLLSTAGYLRVKAKNIACPIDPATREACETSRDYSKWIYFFSVGAYILGFVFAFVAPALMGE